MFLWVYWKAISDFFICVFDFLVKDKTKISDEDEKGKKKVVAQFNDTLLEAS